MSEQHVDHGGDLSSGYTAYRRTVQDSFAQWYGADRDSWSGGPVKSRITEFLLRSAPAAEAGRRRSVLDIGCGRGLQTAQLAEGLDADVVGLDLIDVWAPPVTGRGSLRFQRGDFLGFDERPMDYLVDSGCLHHQRREDWEPWVRHGSGLLRAGGVWAVNIFLSPDGAVVDKRLADGRSNWWLTEEVVTDLFTAHGFTHVASEEVDRNFQYEGHWLKYLTLAFSRVGGRG
ncbi:class I SAM-dependent methyltransferase [Streptomyces sp. NRRL S-31]|uniref:class I SAM-dependent methyltransferase n=1 Tax=Streptomyces sp. NRRL S-31 TaxID=1463898 RepID=UPI00131C5A95|nr:class I SAM-dependent methyltransferase [Streptomyces sp. NRRL S-31]